LKNEYWLRFPAIYVTGRLTITSLLLLYEFLNFRSGAVELSVTLKYCVTSLGAVPQTPREGEQYRRITKI
jgi:hypothetical protein